MGAAAGERRKGHSVLAQVAQPESWSEIGCHSGTDKLGKHLNELRVGSCRRLRTMGSILTFHLLFTRFNKKGSRVQRTIDWLACI